MKLSCIAGQLLIIESALPELIGKLAINILNVFYIEKGGQEQIQIFRTVRVGDRYRAGASQLSI